MLRELQSAADAAEEAERDVVAAISEAQQLLAELDAQPETRWPLRGGCGGLLLVCELTLVLSATLAPAAAHAPPKAHGTQTRGHNCDRARRTIGAGPSLPHAACARACGRFER